MKHRGFSGFRNVLVGMGLWDKWVFEMDAFLKRNYHTWQNAAYINYLNDNKYSDILMYHSFVFSDTEDGSAFWENIYSKLLDDYE